MNNIYLYKSFTVVPRAAQLSHCWIFLLAVLTSRLNLSAKFWKRFINTVHTHKYNEDFVACILASNSPFLFTIWSCIKLMKKKNTLAHFNECPVGSIYQWSKGQKLSTFSFDFYGHLVYRRKFMVRLNKCMFVWHPQHDRITDAVVLWASVLFSPVAHDYQIRYERMNKWEAQNVYNKASTCESATFTTHPFVQEPRSFSPFNQSEALLCQYKKKVHNKIVSLVFSLSSIF